MLTFDDIVKKIQKQKHCCLSVLGKRLSTLKLGDIVKMIQKQEHYCTARFGKRLSSFRPNF
jgi:hypothetical protein